jgi:hypothetical protein
LLGRQSAVDKSGNRVACTFNCAINSNSESQ